MTASSAHPSSAARRRAAVLREMGLGPVWRLRGRDHAKVMAPNAEALAARIPDAAAALPMAAGGVASAPEPQRSTPTQPLERIERLHAAAQSRPSGGEGRQFAADHRSAPLKSAAHDSAPRSSARTGLDQDPSGERARRIATLAWDDLEADIRECRACVLCERRSQAVPGVGDRRARWMLVGEGPGAEEDLRGEPFVGQAGRLLDNMLGSIGLKRGDDVYIANAVKCRPPHNRTPEAGEVAACLPYLERQIDLVQPRLLVALGRPAAQALLGSEVRIGAARGKLFAHRGIPVVVTYHPAYLLRNPQDKGKAWEDLCFARHCMQASPSA